MKITFFTTAELSAKNLRVARLAANRQLNPKAVLAKMKSLRDYGQEVPAIIVWGEEALAEGLEILDFETGLTVSQDDIKDYVVLTDGNHRYQAYLNLKQDADAPYTDDFTFMFPLSDKGGIANMLAEINTCTSPWKGADFVSGAVLSGKKNYPMLDFIHGLTSQGYSLPSASLWATLDRKISSQKMAQTMKNGDYSFFTNDVNLSAGRAIQEAASTTLGNEMLKSRTIAEWVITTRNISDNESTRTKEKKLVSFFASLSNEQVTQLKSIKGTRGGDTKESLLNKKLTEYYTAFCGTNRNTVTI